MNLEDLKSRIAELIGSPGSNKELAFEIFTRNIADNLEFDQAIKIPELGVFQLKKAEEDAASEKPKLVFAPFPVEGGKKDAVYLTIDVDVKKSEDFEFDDNVFSLGADKPIISPTEGEGSDEEASEIQYMLQKSIEDNTADILADGEKLEDFEIKDDMDKISDFIGSGKAKSGADLPEEDEAEPEEEESDFLGSVDRGLDESVESFDDLNFTGDLEKDLTAEIEKGDSSSEFFDTFSNDETKDMGDDIGLDWEKELTGESEEAEETKEGTEEDFFSLLDEEMSEEKRTGEEDDEEEEEPAGPGIEATGSMKTVDMDEEEEEEDKMKTTGTEEAEEVESEIETKVTGEITDGSKFDFSELDGEEEIEITKKGDSDEIEEEEEELPEPGFEGMPEPDLDKEGKKEKEKVDVNALSGFQSLKHQPKRSMGGMLPKVLGIVGGLVIVIVIIYFLFLSGNGTTMEPEKNLPGFEQESTAGTEGQPEQQPESVEQPPAEQPVTEETRRQTPEITGTQQPRTTITQQTQAPAGGKIELENKPVVFYESGVYSLQISSWPDKAKADSEARKLINQGLDAFVVSANLGDKGTWYRVRVGRFNSEAEANKYSSQTFK